jgi:hypothetical protein
VTRGKHVDLLVEGHYELLVHDLADVHNFVLGSKTTGARLASTEVEFVGDQKFTIDLAPGRDAYACSPHFEVMNGHFLRVDADAGRRDEDAVGQGGRALAVAERKENDARPLPAHRRRPLKGAKLPSRRGGREQADGQDVHGPRHVDAATRRGDVSVRKRPATVGQARHLLRLRPAAANRLTPART